MPKGVTMWYMFPEVCVLLTTQGRLQNQERTDADELRLGSGPISTMSILIDAHLRFDLCASKHNSCSCKTRLAQPATISMALHNRPLAGVIWMPDLTERTFLSSPNISPQPRIRHTMSTSFSSLELREHCSSVSFLWTIQQQSTLILISSISL